MARISVTERRELLFAAALRVLIRDGLGSMSVRAIVSEAKMSLASFHYAFDSQEELLVDIMTSVIASERDAALAGLSHANPSTPREAIHGALNAYLELAKAEPGREQGMLELTQHTLRTPPLAHLAAKQYGSYHAAVTELLDHVAVQFELDWDTDTSDLARLAVCLTDGLTLAWLSDRDDAAAARLVDLATDTLLAHLEEA